MIAPADTLATHAGMPFNAADALDTAGTLFSSLPPAPGAGTDSLAASASVLDTAGPLFSSLPSAPGAGTDSLAAVADTLAATGEGWRAASAADLFGEASQLAEPAAGAARHLAALTDSPLFQLLVLGLAAAYLLLLYRNLTDVYALWGMTSIDRAKSSRILQTEGSNYTHFLHAMLALGIPVAGVAAVRLLALALPATLAANVSPHLSAPLAGVAAALLLLVAGVQVAALRIAGEVTLTQPFVGNLLHLKRIYAALAAVAVSPPLLLWVLCTGDSGKWLFYLILCESVILTILYLKESLALFISKKISILHWFLYLCIVEIFPVSLLWLLLVR